MTIEEYVKVKSAFAEAFGDDPPPEWFFVRKLDLEVVLQAIARVKANPLTKFNRDRAGLVLTSVRGTGRRSGLIRRRR